MRNSKNEKFDKAKVFGGKVARKVMKEASELIN